MCQRNTTTLQSRRCRQLWPVVTRWWPDTETDDIRGPGERVISVIWQRPAPDSSLSNMKGVDLFYLEKCWALCWCPQWIIDRSDPDRNPIPSNCWEKDNKKWLKGKYYYVRKLSSAIMTSGYCSFATLSPHQQARSHSTKLKIWIFIADFNDRSPYLHEIWFPFSNMEVSRGHFC